MNNEITKIIKEKKLHPLSYKKNGNVYIIKDKNHTYVIKLNTSNYDIYKYLESRDFLNYPENFNEKGDNYDINEYIEDINEKKEQKINDLLITISLLHFKTSYLRDRDLDEVKTIYEDIKNQIIDTKKYYLELNDLIDKEIFFSPSMYLLVRNISLIYFLLGYSEEKLNIWYKSIEDKKSSRISLIHNNVDINHLIINDDKYLISWDKACFNNPIYDIESFYNKYFHSLSLEETLKIYENKNKLSSDEKELLLIKLAIPEIIQLSKDTLNDIKKINKMIIKLEKVFEFIKKTPEK